MDARLLVAHANSDAKQIRLGAETLIGRSPECNLRIASGQVSRRHCLIKVAEELVSVRDLGSANGTRLNGQAIAAEEDVIIPPGSTLVVGPLKFIVQFTPPKAEDDDTELLYRSGQSASSGTHDVQALATSPVADGEETKDYPPSRTRKRGVPPPVVVSGEGAADGPGESSADRDRDQNRSVQARTTEADFGPISGETVFDVSLEDQAAADAKRLREATGATRSPVGGETDFIFEEEDLRQLASTVEEALAAPPSPGALSGGDAPGLEKPPQQAGWRLLEMLRRPKEPATAHRKDAPVPPPVPTDGDDALQKFLKDQ